LKVARRLLGEFHDGGWLVELASLSDPELVPSVVAGAVGLRPEAGIISAEAIAGAIGARKLLLVLDNCEHVIDAAAAIVDTLVRLCPNVAIMATSREIFRIGGEFVYRVPPLDVPTTEQLAAEQMLAHSASELFITRAKEAGSDFPLQAGNLPTIAAICRHLDGIPLAIEFAAARAAVLGIDRVAAGLADRFALLTSGRRTALPRHRTLRATLDWSYLLLEEPEQRLLRHVSVFPAGFTFEAAAAVMVADGFDAMAVADAVGGLVAKSLLALDKSAPADRWYLLETIRAYAFEKLVECNEVHVVARRHAAYFRDLVTRLVPLSDFGFRSEGLVECLREVDNTRAALDWAFSPGGDVAIGIALTAAYVPVWLKGSMVVECRERTQRALNCLEEITTPDADLRIRILVGLGTALIIAFGPIEHSRRVLGMAFELAERAERPYAQFRAIWGLWYGHVTSRSPGQAAQALAERLFSLSDRIGDPALFPAAHTALGYSLNRRGDHSVARRHLEQVIEFDQATSKEQEIWFLYNPHVFARALLSRVLLLQGFADQAETTLQTSLAEAMAGGSKVTLCVVLAGFVATHALMTGDHAAADAAVDLLADTAAKHGFKQFISLAGHLRGMALTARGELRSGLELLGAGLESDKGEGRRNAFPTRLGALAECLAEVGRLAEAIMIVEEGLAVCENSGERWDVPELLRIKGELLLRRSEAAATQAAEDCFDKATEMARKDGALFWELRIALSLGRLRITQRREAEARAILLPVYERFTEGFATVDLRSARAMLEALS
jgi:predicted ATPase